MTTVYGKTGSNKLPMIEKLWDFYSNKSIKTVVVSIGTSSSPLAELEIAETLGCVLHVVEWDVAKLDAWNETKEILKTRKKLATPFTIDVENKWVLPKNLHISSVLPFFSKGTIDGILTTDFDTYVESICSPMKIENRIDLLNIQVENELPIILALLNSSYRPGLLIITYTHMPDSNIITTQVAGHLQNVGYALIAKEEHKFLYRFVDNNVYEFASYENTTVDNPLLYEFTKELLLNNANNANNANDTHDTK